MTKHTGILVLLGIVALVLLSTVGSYSVIETSDARYAEIGREMFLSGDWLHPKLLDIHHYHKPPFTYQATALGYHLFGINTFGARFFLQIAILLQVLLVYLLTLRFEDNKIVAIWSSAIYLSFPIVLISSRTLTTDAFLATFVLLSIYAWVSYRKSGNFLWLYIFTISLALGFFTKGPVVFLVPVIFAFLYNRLEKSKNEWGWHHVSAWSIFVVIATSWFLYLIIDNPSFWDYFIGRQTVDRFAHNVFSRSEPFWYFIVLAPLLGMPWLFLLPWLIKKLKISFTVKSIEGVLLLAALLPLIFFSMSTSKRILYILPFYPLLAVAISLMLEKISYKESTLYLKIVSGYALLLFLALGIAPWIPGGLLFPSCLTPVSIGLILMLVWFIRTTFLTIKSQSIVISFIAASYFLLAATALLSHSPHSFKMATPATEWIKEHDLDTREILVYNRRLPSVSFELNLFTISLYDGRHSLNRETQFETDTKWKNYFFNLEKSDEQTRLAALIKKEQTLLITYNRELPHNLKWLKDHYIHTKKIGKWKIYY